MIGTSRSSRAGGRVAALLLAAALALAVVDTRAHAVIIGSSLQQSPVTAGVATSVTLRFNSGIEVALSRVFLVTESNARQVLAVHAGTKPGELVVSVPALAEGRYALKYRVFAVDGHLTDDVIRFQVAK